MKVPFEACSGVRRGIAVLLGSTLAGAMLSGCPALPPASTSAPKPASTTARYAAPSDGPTAKLVMRATNLQAGDAFGVFVHDDADNCKGRRMAGAGNSTRAPTTVALAAGALTTVDFVLVKAAKPEAPGKRDTCMLRWSFKPDAGKSYLVAGNALTGGCSGNLIDASNPDAMRVAAGVVRRDNKTNACLPLAQSRAINPAANQSDGEAVLRPEATSDDLQGLIGK